MSKELFISSSPHETKIAVLEDDQLVEVYYERDTDVGLVGGIYKGRVSRVLPGMQSAFVDIGLERDAFLYVSDFFLEDQEEYDKVFEEAEARATRFVAEESHPAETTTPQPAGQAAEVGAIPPVPPPVAALASSETPVVRAGQVRAPEDRPLAPPSPPAPPPRHGVEAATYRRPEHRGRRRRRPGRGFGERGFVRRPEGTMPRTFEILPGESLAKYSHASPGPPPPSSSSTTAAHPGEVGASEGNLVVSPEPPVAKLTTPVGPAPVGIDVPGSEIRTEAAGETQESAFPEVPGDAPPVREEAPADFPHLENFALPEDEHPSTAESPLPAETSEFSAPPHPMSAMGEEPIQDPGWGAAASPAEELAHPAEDQRAESAYLPSVPSPPSAEVSTGSAQGGQVTAETVAETQGGAQPSATGTSAGPTERTYTLREPYERPRYAPRRGPRGRRGRRPPRPGGRPERPGPGNAQAPQIAQLLKEGQEILVQIAKEPLGTKGARITSHIALPGRYLVYMPTIDHTGVSRKIASEQERLRLRNIILENRGSLPGGFIVRTAGEGRPEEEMKADLRFLASLWSDIKARAERAKAPVLIHRDLDLVQRILRDTLSPDFKSVRVDSEAEYERVVEFVSRCQPSLAGHVKLYTRDTPLFDEFRIEEEIEKALKPKVWLKSGGYIVINQTEALVAIDVNTGKYVGKTNRLEDTILKTNIEAVNEIVRQIRLRDLGGIIVIDFIDMDERRNRFKVFQALEDALRRDRAPTKVTSFHDFGLVAITRKRVKQSLERTLCEPCDYCSGAGWVKSVSTVCYEILAEAKKMAKQIEGDVLTLRVSPDVAKGLKSREGVLISELESITHKDVIIKGDPAVHRERFEIF